jgi:hypothetical protein
MFGRPDESLEKDPVFRPEIGAGRDPAAPTIGSAAPGPAVLLA